MRFNRVVVAIAFALLGLGVVPAGASAMLQDQPVIAAQTLTQFYILTEDNRIVTANSADPTQLGTPIPVNGLTVGDSLVAIDVRPQNGRLYGLGYNATAGSVRLYHISPTNGVADALGTASATLTQADGVTPRQISGTRFGLDFNPTVDRARVVTNTSLNFRINPNTGAIVDTVPAVPGNQADGDINGGTTTVDETAYTNSAPNVTVTTQYTIDPATDRLYIQNPPNNGTQTAGLPVRLAGAPLDFFSANGFDIPPGVDVATANAPATGVAFAAIGTGTSVQLHSIELSTGAATLLGTPPGISVRGLAVWMPLPIANALAADGTTLQRFRLDTPGTVASATITGITAGETLVGIDGRPTGGQLYGLGVNDTLNTGTLYQIDPQTGAATSVGTPGQIAFVTAAGVPVDLPAAASGYGFDFNPTVDRGRVTTDSGLNFRINPNNGAPVDGDAAAAGTNPDGNINGLPAGSTGVSATAYTNVFAGTTVTTQYSVDSTSKRLYIQNPPNAGTQTMGLLLNVGGSPLDFSVINGFDIPTGVNTATANAPVSGNAYAVLTVGATSGLYRIDLATGATTSLGPIGTGATGGMGLVVWSEMTPGLRVSLPMIMKSP